MKKLQIFEPAMCCDTGLCGVSIDPELLRMAALFSSLVARGISAQRFNLNSTPMEFISNSTVNKQLMEKGVEILPITFVDDHVMLTGRYPTNVELTEWLGLPDGCLSDIAAESTGGCCSNGGCC